MYSLIPEIEGWNHIDAVVRLFADDQIDSDLAVTALRNGTYRDRNAIKCLLSLIIASLDLAPDAEVPGATEAGGALRPSIAAWGHGGR